MNRVWQKVPQAARLPFDDRFGIVRVLQALARAPLDWGGKVRRVGRTSGLHASVEQPRFLVGSTWLFFCPALRPHGQENFGDGTSRLSKFADRDAFARAIPSINYGSGGTHVDSKWVAFGYDWRFRLTFARSLGP